MSPIIYCNNLYSLNNTVFKCEHISFINETRWIQWAGLTKMARWHLWLCNWSRVSILHMAYSKHGHGLIIPSWLSTWFLWLFNLWTPLPRTATYLKHLCPGTEYYIYLECYFLFQLMYSCNFLKHPWTAQIGIFQKLMEQSRSKSVHFVAHPFYFEHPLTWITPI